MRTLAATLAHFPRRLGMSWQQVAVLFCLVGGSVTCALQATNQAAQGVALVLAGAAATYAYHSPKGREERE